MATKRKTTKENVPATMIRPIGTDNVSGTAIPSSSVEKNLLSAWGFPPKILNHYLRKGISRFFDWQVECLELPGILEQRRNLVYSAPTSAGKTMVSDVLLFKTLLEKRKKAIVILPFVSITIEKVESLKGLCRSLGLRIDSFAGNVNPRGGLQRVNVAVCTIEKANNMINRLIEDGKLSEIGMIIVDELHMIGDTSRGYLLELLLTKLIFLKKIKSELNDLQIVGMSATIPNLADVAKWLDAELYITDYRPVPLDEYVVVDRQIMTVEQNVDTQTSQRSIGMVPAKTIDLSKLELEPDPLQTLIFLTIETVLDGYSTLIFCPTKSLCESLSRSISKNIFNIGRKGHVPKTDFERQARERLLAGEIFDATKIMALINALKRCPAGADANLLLTVRFGCAHHHAGLTMEERGAVEQSFRDGTIKILCSTTTLSAGVNLPARRVMITSPFDYGSRMLDVTCYRQMIGRAGRKGIDTLGESYLFCQPKNITVVRNLVSSALKSVKSHLIEFEWPRRQRVRPKKDDDSDECSSPKAKIDDHLLRAVLEVVCNGLAEKFDDIVTYLHCTFFSNCPLNLDEASQSSLTTDKDDPEYFINRAIQQVLEKLMKDHFICFNLGDETDKASTAEIVPHASTVMPADAKIVITRMGKAVIASGIMPSDGCFILKELERCRQNLCLVNDLHLVYETTPTYLVAQLSSIDWYHYMEMFRKLDVSMKKIAELIGIREFFLFAQVSGQPYADPGETTMKMHKRFYASLALYELIQEKPMLEVQKKYGLNKGLLQSLQQQAGTFAGMLATFCNRLGWSSLELLIEQFQPRLAFGVQRELIDLIRIPCLSSTIARQLYDKGYDTVVSLIYCKPADIETVLISAGAAAGQEFSDYNQLAMTKIYIANIDKYLTIRDLSKLILTEARILVETDVGQVLKFDDDDDDDAGDEPETETLPPVAAAGATAAATVMSDILEQTTDSFVKANATNAKRMRPDSTSSSCSSLQALGCSPTKMVKSSPCKIGSLVKTKSTNQKNLFMASTPKTTIGNIPKSPSRSSSPPQLYMSLDDESLLQEMSIYAMTREVRPAAFRSPDTVTKEKSPEILDDDDYNEIMEVKSKPQSSSLTISTLSTLSLDLNDDNLQMMTSIRAKPETDATLKTDAGISPAAATITASNRNEMEEPDDDVDKFLRLFSTRSAFNRKNPLPSFHEIQIPVDRYQVQPVTGETECRDLLKQLFPLPHPAACSTVNTVAIHFHLIHHTALGKRSQAFFRRRSSTSAVQADDDPNGDLLPLKNSGRWCLSSLYLKRWNDRKLYWLYGREVLQWLKSNWYRHLADVAGSSSGRPADISFSSQKKTCRLLCYDVKQTAHCLYEALDFDRQFLYYDIDWYDVSVGLWLLDPDSKPFDISIVQVEDLARLAMKHQLDAGYFHKVNNVRTLPVVVDNNNCPKTTTPPPLNYHQREQCLKTFVLFNLIYGLLVKLRERNLYRSYRLIEMPSRLCLFLLETNPVPVDQTYLNQVEDQVLRLMRTIEDKIFGQTGSRFNLASADQVARVLYSQCNLISNYLNVTSKSGSSTPKNRKATAATTSSRLPKHLGTSKAALYKLQDACGKKTQLPLMVIEWRRLNHALTNSIQAVRRYGTTAETSLSIYCRCIEWSLTGRISMHQPNLINLDKDFEISTAAELDETGVEPSNQDDRVQIRKMIRCANERERLVAADYSQLELRIMAHFSKDPNLLAVMNEPGSDVFKSIAASWKNIPYDQVDQETRQQAKQICYGIIYGIGDDSLAEKLAVTREEASRYKLSFFERYTMLDQFIQASIDECRERGHVETIAARRRPLPTIHSTNHSEMAKACRQAVNTKIQGSAADIIKIAMVAIQREIDQHQFRARFILQMHDELMFLVHEEDVHAFGRCLKRQMENVSRYLEVRLPVKVQCGHNWSELKEMEMDLC